MENKEKNESTTSIKWEIKKDVTPLEYKDCFPINNANSGGTNDSKKAKAYEAASDIRKFEIGLYWQRTAYFWAFITVIYTAYYHILKDNTDHGALPLVVFSFLGLFFSISWFLSNKASKHWQKNWELHMDLLEDDVTGPLYKTYLAERSYSVSKINLAASIIISFFAALLFLYESYKCACNKLSYFRKTGVYVSLEWILWFAFICIVFAGFWFYIKKVRGNDAKKGEEVLQQKVYPDFGVEENQEKTK